MSIHGVMSIRNDFKNPQLKPPWVSQSTQLSWSETPMGLAQERDWGAHVITRFRGQKTQKHGSGLNEGRGEERGGKERGEGREGREEGR